MGGKLYPDAIPILKMKVWMMPLVLSNSPNSPEKFNAGNKVEEFPFLLYAGMTCFVHYKPPAWDLHQMAFSVVLNC